MGRSSPRSPRRTSRTPTTPRSPRHRLDRNSNTAVETPRSRRRALEQTVMMENGGSLLGEPSARNRSSGGGGFFDSVFGSVNQGEADYEAHRLEDEPLLGGTPAMERALAGADEHVGDHSFMGDGEIDIEDFGFAELEVRPSVKKQGVVAQISQLKDNVLNYKVPRYLDQYDAQQEKESLLVGSVTVEEIELQEVEIERRHIEDAARLAEAHAQRQQELTHLEIDARERVDRLWQQHAAQAHSRELQRLDLHRQRVSVLEAKFKQAEDALKVALERRQAEVSVYYGDLVPSEDVNDSLNRRHFELDWSMAPQPIEIEVHALRGLRDKLPQGHFVLQLSMYDQLAGKALAWAELGKTGDEKWYTALQPKTHDGRHDTVAMNFNKSLYTVAPAPTHMKPSYTLIFQLFMLRGDKKPKTTEVGWAAFPLSDPTFVTVQGMFKTPMLRGQMDPKLDRYQEIEEMVKYDIDNWLGNLYFRVNHLERYIDGQREFDVQLARSREILSQAPPDPKGNNWNEELAISETELKERAAVAGEEPEDESWVEKSKRRRKSMRVTPEQAVPERPFPGQRELNDEELDGARVVDYDKEGRPEFAQPAEQKPGDERPRWQLPGCHLVSFCFGDSLAQQAAHRDALIAAQEAKARIEGGSAGTSRRHAEDWIQHKEHYQYHLDQPVGTLEKRKASSKFQYVMRSLSKDLGFSQPRSLEFVCSTLLCVLLFFVRMHIHYLGEYLALKIQNVVVNSFSMEALRMVLDYDAAVLQVRTELSVVLLGPVTVIFGFVLAAGIAAFCNWWLDDFPEYGCRAIAVFGILAMLDPYLIALVDCMYLPSSYPTGDMFKLYYKFLVEESSGITGVVMTAISYLLLSAFQGLFLFHYLLTIHMQGHMHDVYARLHGDKFAFFMPDDSEVSWREVQYVCRRAKEWRGPQGELHRVQVVDYIHRDRHDTNWEDCTTAITIFELDVSGARSVFRQFVRLPNGAIVEKFGAERMDTSSTAESSSQQRNRSHASGGYGVLLDAMTRPEITKRRERQVQGASPTSAAAPSMGTMGPSRISDLLNSTADLDQNSSGATFGVGVEMTTLSKKTQ